MERITDQRKKILQLLVEFSYLGISDFYRLLPDESPSRPSHERRLRRLLHDFTELGYLRSFPVIDPQNSGRVVRYQTLYWLSSKGLDLAQECGLENGEGKANDEHSPRTLDHEYAITNFHFSLKEFAAEHALDLYWRQKDLKKSINPDAMLALAKDDKAFYYFLEIEKSKLGKYVNGEPQILRKLVKYYEYFDSDLCEADWSEFRQFRVLVIVQTEARRQNLLKCLPERYRHPMFWVATQHDCLSFLTAKDFEKNISCFLEPVSDKKRCQPARRQGH